MTDPVACDSCHSQRLEHETDVLDTWFSSALWPFSTMGWPDQTVLLRTFYPTSVLVTGFDILFFWVARMMMMGLHFMDDVPFRDVYVHALVRDEEGKKMSKSKGNVIDPLDIIEKYGTDAFRFTLAAFAAQGRDVKMSEKRVEGYRNFINKLWNAARFALMHVDRGYADFTNKNLSLSNRWMLSRLGQVAAATGDVLDAYRFNEAAGAVYQFVWHEFCDWYLEAIKPALYGRLGEAEQEVSRKVLWFALRDILILLHPFIPFVTEEIWHKMPGTRGSIMTAVYPCPKDYLGGSGRDEEAERQMTLVTEIITGIRNVRGEMGISPSINMEVTVQAPQDEIGRIVSAQQEIIINLARLKSLAVQKEGPKPKAAATTIVGGTTLFIGLQGVIDVHQETARLEKEIDRLTQELAGVRKKLANEDFLGKAPAEVVAKVKQKHMDLLEKQQQLQATRDRIKAIEF
jgi:valyl-tRNA synthetase